MTYEPLPDTLKIKDRVACPAHYPDPAIYEVFKVDGDHVWLMNEAGLALLDNLTVELLKSYDYKLLIENK